MKRGIAGAGVALLLGVGLTACSDEPEDCATNSLSTTAASPCTPPSRGPSPTAAPPATQQSVKAVLPTKADMAGLETEMPTRKRYWVKTPGEDGDSRPAVCEDAKEVCASLTAYGASEHESADGESEAVFEVYGYPGRAEAKAAQESLAVHKTGDGVGRPKDIPSGGEVSRGVELGSFRSPSGHGMALQYRSYMVWIEFKGDPAQLSDTEDIQELSRFQLRKIDEATKGADDRTG